MAISGVQGEEHFTSTMLILRQEAFFQTHDSLKNMTKKPEEPELSFQSGEVTGMERFVVKNVHGRRQGFPPLLPQMSINMFSSGI